MWEWIGANSQLVSTVVSLILMVVWIVYLNLFLLNMRHTRRPVIMLSRGAGQGEEARLFISNMGGEPIYIAALIADCDTPDGPVSALVTRNDDLSTDSLSNWKEATNEGPLGSGDYMDAGAFGSLLARIVRHGRRAVAQEEIRRITLTVVANSGHSATISAGRKSYRVLRHGDGVAFRPEAVSTEQLRNPLARRRIRQRLEAELRAETEAMERDRQGAAETPRRAAE